MKKRAFACRSRVAGFDYALKRRPLQALEDQRRGKTLHSSMARQHTVTVFGKQKRNTETSGDAQESCRRNAGAQQQAGI